MGKNNDKWWMTMVIGKCKGWIRIKTKKRLTKAYDDKYRNLQIKKLTQYVDE